MSLLRKLFGGRKAVPEERPPEFLVPSPPDWLIAVEGRWLPQRKILSVRAQLTEASRKAAAEVTIGSRDPGAPVERAAGQLERTEIDRLLVILGMSFPNDITSLSVEIVEGLPLNIVIYRREPFTKLEAHCNLTGWFEIKRTPPPVVEISKILISFQRRTLAFITDDI